MTFSPAPTRETDIARFMAKTRRTDSGCLEWTARRNPAGYGGFKLRGNWMLAHRAAYMLFVGGIPDGLDILHGCDNPPCVEPSHLRPGTDLDNARDRVERGRAPRKLSDEQVAEIRALHGVESQRAIACRFGVAQSYVSLLQGGGRR